MPDSNQRVSEDDVRRIAELSRLTIGDDEIERYREQMGSVLDRFEKLDDVDVEETESEELANIVRPDIIDDSLTQNEALSTASETEDGYFKGPATN